MNNNCEYIYELSSDMVGTITINKYPVKYMNNAYVYIDSGWYSWSEIKIDYIKDKFDMESDVKPRFRGSIPTVHYYGSVEFDRSIDEIERYCKKQGYTNLIQHKVDIAETRRNELKLIDIEIENMKNEFNEKFNNPSK